jgi:hypothetical protein
MRVKDSFSPIRNCLNCINFKLRYNNVGECMIHPSYSKKTNTVFIYNKCYKFKNKNNTEVKK